MPKLKTLVDVSEDRPQSSPDGQSWLKKHMDEIITGSVCAVVGAVVGGLVAPSPEKSHVEQKINGGANNLSSQSVILNPGIPTMDNTTARMNPAHGEFLNSYLSFGNGLASMATTQPSQAYQKVVDAKRDLDQKVEALNQYIIVLEKRAAHPPVPSRPQ